MQSSPFFSLNCFFNMKKSCATHQLLRSALQRCFSPGDLCLTADPLHSFRLEIIAVCCSLSKILPTTTASKTRSGQMHGSPYINEKVILCKTTCYNLLYSCTCIHSSTSLHFYLCEDFLYCTHYVLQPPPQPPDPNPYLSLTYTLKPSVCGGSHSSRSS